MMNIKLIDTQITMAFSLCLKEDYTTFKQEFDKLSDIEQDPLQQWVKLAKARGDTKDSDNVLLHLLIELHRKVDNIEKQLQNKKESYIPLDHHSQIVAIGHEHFKLAALEEDTPFIIAAKLYGRITMPIFPKRIVPLFFSHYEEDIYHIELMHERDINDYDAYITSKERALIREQRGYND